MIVAGVDIGKRRLAVATILLDARGSMRLIDTIAILVHPTMRGKELLTLQSSFHKLGLQHAWNHVFVEEPPVGRSAKASMDLSQTVGVVLSEAHSLGANGQLVNVKTWKKQVVGNGNASKEDVSRFLARDYPAYSDACGEDQDQRDACCIGIFGVQTVRYAGDLAEHRLVLGESPEGA